MGIRYEPCQGLWGSSPSRPTCLCVFDQHRAQARYLSMSLRQVGVVLKTRGLVSWRVGKLGRGFDSRFAPDYTHARWITGHAWGGRWRAGGGGPTRRCGVASSCDMRGCTWIQTTSTHTMHMLM